MRHWEHKFEVSREGADGVSRYSQLDRAIIQAIVAHISKNEEISLTELAQECHVAKSSVVKALQKLGYRGFAEFTKSIRINAQTNSGSLLPRAVAVDGLEATSDRLASCLARHRHHRNFIFSGDRRYGDLLAAYMSRKLALFGIFAPSTYDYAMTAPGEYTCGAAFFCFHRGLPGATRFDQPEGYGMGMLHAARKAGFEIVILTDDRERSVPHDADLVLQISPNSDVRVDLYVTRSIMLFETALAKLARM